MIRLYGHQLGYTSFSQVTRGFALALHARDLFGGFVPLDFFDEDTAYPGAQCRMSINTGMPSGVARAKTVGAHQERYLMLAPNSDRIPERMRQWLPDFVTGLLGPSKWACSVLKAMCPSLPVHLVPHGVHDEYRPDPALRQRTVAWYTEHEVLRYLHLTSTNSARKGTKLLLDAWQAMERWRHELVVVCRYEGYDEMLRAVADRGLQDRVTVRPSDGMDYEGMRRMYVTHHLLCQPSRGEGFGLCPLEAKACGVPVVMTDCTGHADHAFLGATVRIQTGADAPSDDMDDATTPHLEVDAITAALRHSAVHYLALEERALESAEDIRRFHSWPATTGDAVRRIYNR